MKKMVVKFTKMHDTIKKLSLLSKQRLELLWRIKELNPSSVYELANSLQKSQPYVKKEVELLAEVGLISLEKSKINGRSRIKPVMNYSLLALEIDFLGLNETDESIAQKKQQKKNKKPSSEVLK